jgi:hypothetical protein
MQEDFLFINVFYTDVTVVCWCRWFLDKSPRDNREAGVALQLGYVIGVHRAHFPDADADYAPCITLVLVLPRRLLLLRDDILTLQGEQSGILLNQIIGILQGVVGSHVSSLPPLLLSFFLSKRSRNVEVKMCVRCRLQDNDVPIIFTDFERLS